MTYSRRSFLEMGAIAAAAKVMPAYSSGEKQTRPNFIFMLGDDHRWDALGCMGNKIIHTPNLDKLAAEGVIFENHFTTTPICCASRASIMLGQYAATHGIYDFSTPLSSNQVQQTYWMQLKHAGYRIGFIGKFGVGKTMPSEAFDYWKGFPGQGKYFPEGPNGPHLTNIIRDQANDFIDTSSDQPFCLSISFKAPHVQDEDPKQYLPSRNTLSLYEGITMPPHGRAGSDDVDRFPLAIQHSESRHRWGVRFATPDTYQASMKGYYRLISGIDAAVASIRKALETKGIADNTVIVYSADHGIFNGEHGFAGKWYAHEESIRMPLIIYDPRQPTAFRGKRRLAMTLNIDLHPTILEMAGLKPSEQVQGKSLINLLHADDSNFRPAFFIEHHFPYGGWIPSSESIRTKKWKYIAYTDYAVPYEELYNLKSDPFETRNLIDNIQYSHQQGILTSYRKIWRDSLHNRSGKWSEPINQKDFHEIDLTA